MVKGIHAQKLNCELCWERFDLKSRQPLMLKNCGHTACQKCVKNVIQGCISDHKRRLQCPKCRAFHDFQPSDLEDFQNFPKNFTLINILELSKESKNCEHSAGQTLYVCLDSECADREPFCIKCHVKNHVSCYADHSMLLSEFSSKVHFDNSNCSQSYDFNKIRADFKNLIIRVEKAFAAAVDNAEYDLTSNLPTDKQLTYEMFLRNKDKLILDWQEENVVCRPHDVQGANDFLSLFTNDAIVTVFQSLELMIDKLPTWDEFKEITGKNSQIFKDIQFVNKKFTVDLSNCFRKEIPDRIQEYIKNIRKAAICCEEIKCESNCLSNSKIRQCVSQLKEYVISENTLTDIAVKVRDEIGREIATVRNRKLFAHAKYSSQERSFDEMDTYALFSAGDRFSIVVFTKKNQR